MQNIRKNIKLLLVLFTINIASVVMAQNLNTGYFDETFLYRHDLNPAFAADNEYVSAPIIGNANVGMRGNVGIKDILYRVNGKTVLFLNPAVDAKDFAGRINDNSKVVADYKMQLLGAGFNWLNGFNTVELNVKATGGLTMPGNLLKAMKEGLTNDDYDFSNAGVTSNGYAEVALGHSRQVNDNLRFGAKFKLLLGMESLDVDMKQASLSLGEDNYVAAVDADVNANIKDLSFKHLTNKNTGHKYVDAAVEGGKVGITGVGVALDLGAAYKKGNFEISASLQDIGLIGYMNTLCASTQGTKTFETDKYIFSVDSDSPNGFSKEWKTFKNDLASLYELDDMGHVGSRTKMLGMTMNLGVKCNMPFYDKLSVGISNTSRFQGRYSWTDFRLGINVHPVDLISLSANVSAGTFGVGFGWLANFHTPKGYNFFVGMDTTPGQFSKQFIPLSSNAQFSVGLNLPLCIFKESPNRAGRDKGRE